ncbi:hypothetical protein ACWEQL_07345 [Kitasatospora sp. NPDC004240]
MTSTGSQPAPPSARRLCEGPLPLAPGSPWSVRSARTQLRRPALELYEHGELVDVLAATRLAPVLLGGARQAYGPAGGSVHALAWGRLPQDGRAPAVGFAVARLRLPARLGLGAGRRAPVAAGEVLTVAGEFWLARARGPFDEVRVLPRDGGPGERARLMRAARPRTAGAA